MDIQNILLLITAGVNLALALFVFLTNQRDKTSILFMLLVLSLGLWSFGVAMFRYASLQVFALNWLKFYFTVGVLIAYWFYYFAYYYPYVLKQDPKIKFIFHLALVIVSILITVIGSSYVESYRSFKDVTLNQPKHLFFIAYFIYMTAAGFYMLGKKIKNASGYSRFQLTVVFTATMVAGIFGIFFDVILPEFTYELIYIGPYATVAMAYIVFYYLFLRAKS